MGGYLVYCNYGKSFDKIRRNTGRKDKIMLGRDGWCRGKISEIAERLELSLL